MPDAAADLVAYYARRAPEYEAIYDKPERQRDLAVLRREIPTRLHGRDVIEVACGTGYWTALVAPHVRRLAATDAAAEPMRLAREKPYPPGVVAFHEADAYALPSSLGTFDAALAVFWWSHVPRGRIPAFLASLHARLWPGARVVLMDNRYVEASNTPIERRDAEGNTYQRRRLADGTEASVLKNFPSEAELRADLAPHAVSYLALEYYWLAQYDLP